MTSISGWVSSQAVSVSSLRSARRSIVQRFSSKIVLVALSVPRELESSPSGCSCSVRLQHSLDGRWYRRRYCATVRWKDGGSLGIMANIQRIKGKPGDQYEVLFVDQHGHLVVALTEWYRLRTKQGYTSTRDTYLTCLLPF